MMWIAVSCVSAFVFIPVSFADTWFYNQMAQDYSQSSALMFLGEYSIFEIIRLAITAVFTYLAKLTIDQTEFLFFWRIPEIFNIINVFL